LRDREEPKTRKVIQFIENVKESEDSEIAKMVNSGKVKDHTLEKLL